MIAEDLRSDPAVTRPPAEGGAGFGAQWDRGFVHPVRAALIAPSDEARDLDAVADALLVDPADAFKRVIYTESHDEVANGSSRVPEEIWPGYADSWPSRKRAALGAALVLTAPGIPMLFQGQELIEGSWFTDEEPLDWSKRHRHAGLLQLHRDLIRLRRNGDDTHARAAGPPHHGASPRARTPGSSPTTAGRRVGRATMSSCWPTSPRRRTPTTASACRGRAAGGCASTATGRATTPSSRRSPRSTPTPVAEPLDGMPFSISGGRGPLRLGHPLAGRVARAGKDRPGSDGWADRYAAATRSGCMGCRL